MDKNIRQHFWDYTGSYNSPKAEVFPFSYNYAVNDDYSGSAFTASESDNKLGARSVTYSTDDVNGYVADVSYKGASIVAQSREETPISIPFLIITCIILAVFITGVGLAITHLWRKHRTRETTETTKEEAAKSSHDIVYWYVSSSSIFIVAFNHYCLLRLTA